MSESTVTTNIPRIRKPFGVEVPPRVPYLESSDNCGDNGHAIYIKNRKFVQSTKLINDVQWEQLFNLSGSQLIANITIEGNTIPVYAPLGGGGGGGTTTAIKVPVLTPLWFDRKVNDAGWITPGTGNATKFTSTAAGNSNTKIFEHLIDDLGGSGMTTATDTYTRTTGSVIKVTYYVAKTSGGIQDGHKIIHIGTSSACSIEVTESGTTTTYAANNADNLSNILKYLKELYDDVSIGTSWYYVVSGTKANGGYFYLPRTRYGFHGTAGYAKLQRNTNKPTENEMFLYFYTGYDDDAVVDVQGERFIDVANSSNNDRIKVVKLKNTLAASTVYPVVGANGSNQITPPALDGTYGLYITDSRSLSIKQASPNQFGVVKVPASAAFLGSDANGQLVAKTVQTYTLPAMTTSVLGGAKVGNGLTISSEKLAVLKDPNGPVTVSSAGVTVQDCGTGQKGVVKIGDGLAVSGGLASVKKDANGPVLVSSNGVSVQDATTGQKGVVKIGSGLSVSGGTVSADAQTPTAGTLISVSGRQVSVKNSFNGSAPFVGFDATKGELVAREEPTFSLTQDAFDILYPVGSVYISVTAKSAPFQNISGITSTWVQLATGRTLWNVAASGQLGETVNGVLPKHNHTLQLLIGHSGTSVKNAYDRVDSDGVYGGGTTGGTTIDSTVSNVGIGNTLRPPSVTCTMWKRTA